MILVFAKMVHLMCTVLVAAPATMDTLELTAQRILMNVHRLNPCQLVKAGQIAQIPWEVLPAHAQIHALGRTAMLVVVVPVREEEIALVIIQICLLVPVHLGIVDKLVQNF